MLTMLKFFMSTYFSRSLGLLSREASYSSRGRENLKASYESGLG